MNEEASKGKEKAMSSARKKVDSELKHRLAEARKKADKQLKGQSASVEQ